VPQIAPAIIHYDDTELDDVLRGQVFWVGKPAKVSVYEWQDNGKGGGRLVIVDQITSATIEPLPDGRTEISGNSLALARLRESDTDEPLTVVVEPTKAGCCQ
jgi:hypothetical protein